MHPRQPGIWCGPNIRCAGHEGDPKDIAAPPAENGRWIDGVNTFVDKGDRQGFAHKENYDLVFTTTTTTEENVEEPANPDEPNGNGNTLE